MNECTFTDCKRDGKTSSGLCYGHDKQRLENRPLTPLRKYKKADIGIPGWRQCSVCDEIKKEDQFYRRANGTLRANCKQCHREAQNAD